MLTSMIKHVHHLKFLLNENSTTILTGVGVTGTVATAYLSGRASFKAARIIAEEQEATFEKWREAESDIPPMELALSTKLKLVWPLYIAPVGVGLTTMASIIFAHRISTKQIAALTVAGGISERALQEYKDKVVEKLGNKEDQKLRDGVAQDRVNASNQEVILVGQGQVLCYDLMTDRYFQSTVEEIKRAENEINAELLQHMAASLAEFHDKVGLRPTDYTDSVGWSSPEMFKVVFSSVLSPDGRPCLAIDFERPPQLEYNHKY